MLDIKQIESFYPRQVRPFKKNLLREYLQYKILEIIFNSKFGNKLSFMGGTAIRIIYSNSRFSEDLDFDNLGLNQKEFKQLSELIQKKLEIEGYKVEIKNTFKNAYRSYVRIYDVFSDYGISGHKQEKLLIQVDTEPQNFKYEQNKIILNKFDVFLQINSVPVDVLLSQKIYAILNRKRTMGRDFYDVVFLLGRTKINFEYLKFKLKVKNRNELKEMLLLKCRKLDFKQLEKDVKPFLFDTEDVKKVAYFYDYIKEYQF